MQSGLKHQGGAITANPVPFAKPLTEETWPGETTDSIRAGGLFNLRVLGFRVLGFRASPLRTRRQSHARMAPPTHLKGVGVAAYSSCCWSKGVTLGEVVPRAGPTSFLLPPLCRTAGKPPTFPPFRV